MSLPQTLEEWLEYISRQHTAAIVMGLDRVRTVWERMGRPQAPVNITVGGTNGKGSTCAMLESMLVAAGYRTGFYTSPHITRYNERVRLDKREADDALLIASFEAVELARAAAPTIPLTYFEFGTLSALWIFAQRKVDIGILEVGLGGRLDAVNIVDADVSIVTSVDLDHQAFLGDTREKIGWEKAHIYRRDRPAIFGDAEPPASVLSYAGNIGAKLSILNRDYRIQRMDNQWSLSGRIDDRDVSRPGLPFPALRGSYQLKNASAALMALAALSDRVPVSIGHLKRGLLEVEWPGRMQVLPGRPTVVLDVAHNPHAARALDDALGGMAFHPHTYAVFAMLKDKDIGSVVRTLAHRIDHWFVAGLPGERGTTAEELASILRAEGQEGRFTLFTRIGAAYAAAREQAGQDDRILAFGSFLTVAEVMEAVRVTH
jgi:dihydrofolate synthase/folylpolyglutamate synthase